MDTLTLEQNDSLKKLLEIGLTTLVDESRLAGAKDGTATVGALIGNTLFIMCRYFNKNSHYPLSDELKGKTLKEVGKIFECMYTFPDAGDHEGLCNNPNVSETEFQILASISSPNLYKNSSIAIAAIEAMKRTKDSYQP